ncbi:hypothetical protein BN946_scf184846.g3 [Trametes cinnabarina]|uniref:DUF6818 domain-containing protein n=1 Tax=Pycnoporus cinnabarinus TaxID=5643 RepID=A0A060SJ39_PYCCI|nr:hypothetical protein BN946_scf184846.g3 [Trametes cinnabarina]
MLQQQPCLRLRVSLNVVRRARGLCSHHHIPRRGSLCLGSLRPPLFCPMHRLARKGRLISPVTPPTPSGPLGRATDSSKGKKRASEPVSRAAPEKKAKPALSRSAPAQPKPAPNTKGKQTLKAPMAAYSGRQPGSSNYNEDDLDALLDVVQEDLPIGQKMWQRVTDQFNDWARVNSRPPRTQKPLKTKFESLARTPKPTGSADVPANVERAWEIEERIHEKMHVETLDDSEIADGDGDGGGHFVEVNEADQSDNDIEIVEPPSRKASRPPVRTDSSKTHTVVKGFHDQSGPPARSSAASRRAQANDFMTSVTRLLDPAARDARDESRFARQLVTDEISRLTAENRDYRTRNEQLMDRAQQQSAELARLQARVDMLEMLGAHSRRRSSRYNPWDSAEESPRHHRGSGSSQRHPRYYGSHQRSSHLSPPPHYSPPASPSDGWANRRHRGTAYHRSPSPVPLYQPSPSMSAPHPMPPTYPPGPSNPLPTLAALATSPSCSYDDSATYTLTLTPSRRQRHPDGSRQRDDEEKDNGNGWHQ